MVRDSSRARARHAHSNRRIGFGSGRAGWAAVEQAGHMAGEHIRGGRFRKHQVDQSGIPLELFVADVRADAQNESRRSRSRPRLVAIL